MDKVKILVVEDEPSILAGYSMVLCSKNFRVFEAKDGSEGLGIAIREKPDLILSDIMMPIMDGIDMLKELREGDEYTKKVPVVLLTNLNVDVAKIEEKIPEPGPVYYILKSEFNFRQVVERIEEILAHKL